MAISSTKLVALESDMCFGSTGQAKCEESVARFADRLTSGLSPAQGDKVIDKTGPLFREIQRFCFHVGNEYKNTGTFNSGSCIAGILDNPASRKAGDSNIVTFNKGPKRGQREKRTLFGPGSAVQNPYEGMPITTKVTTFENLFQAGKNAVIPPIPPLPIPPPVIAPIGSPVVIAAGGEREKKPFITKPDAPKPMPLENGKIKVEYIHDDEGLRGSVSVSGGKTIHKGQKGEVGVSGSFSASQSPNISSNDPHYIHSPGASPSAPHTDFHLSLNGKWAWNGSLDESYPTADFVEDNYSARKLEAMCLAKWGDKAGGIYLDSVLRKQMAAKPSITLEEAWNEVVAKGALKYQEFLTGTALPDPSEAEVWANLFKYDPAGFVEMIALWSGESYQKMMSRLIGQASALVISDDSNRVQNFKAFIEGARGLNLTKNFQLPQVPSGSAPLPNPHEESFPSMMALEVDSAKLAAKEEEFTKARNKTEDELRAIATTANVPYPFDIANASNPWMAQANFERLIAEMKKGSDKKATWFGTFDLGLLDYGMAYRGLGILPGVLYAPDENWIVNAKLYLGYQDSGIKDGGVHLVDSPFGAMALSTGVEWHTLQKKKNWLKELVIEAGVAGAFNNVSRDLLSGSLALNAPFALSDILTLKPYVSASGSTGSGFSSYQLAPGAELSRKFSEVTTGYVDLNYAIVRKYTDFSANDAPAADGSVPTLNDDTNTEGDPNVFGGTDETHGDNSRTLRAGVGVRHGRFEGGAFLLRGENLDYLATDESAEGDSQSRGSEWFFGLSLKAKVQ